MELFSMLAKLTLDASDFESKLKAAEQEATGFDLEDPTLGLDDSEFQQGINNANDAEVDDLDDPSLGLDDGEFTSGVSNANAAEVDDLDDPSLGLDDSDFTSGVTEANAAEVDDLEDPKLGLDDSEFTSGLKDAETEGISFGEIMGQVFENVKTALVTTGIVSLIGSFVGFLKQGVTLAGQNGDAIDKQSQKLHLSAQAYQEWNYALGLSGASIDDLNRGLRTWTQAGGDEEKAKKLSAAFESLGIDAGHAMDDIERAASGHGTLDNLLSMTLGALADYEGGDKGYLVSVLFGNNANGLNALLNSTSAEIKEMKQEANDLGLIMSDEDVKNAAAYTDATSRLQQAVDALKTSLGEQLLPLLTDAANTIAKIVAFFNPRTGQQTLSEMFGDKDGEFAEELLTIEGTAAAAETLADKLLSMGDTSKMTADQYAIWKGTAESLIALVPDLGKVIDTETGQINANSEEIKENIKQWENLAKQKALQTLKEEKYQAIVEKNKDLIDQTVEANKKAGETEKARVESLAAINDILTQNGYDALGKNATLEDVFAAQTKVTTDNPDNAQLQVQLANAIGTWTSANQKAIEAQEKVNSLTEEVQKGEQEYQDWIKAAESMYGTVEEDANSSTSAVKALGDELAKLPSIKEITIDTIINWNGNSLMQKAIGDAYIPYDMPIYAHRGERILTATEARKSASGSMDYSALRNEITGAIREGMNGASVNSYLNGQDITDNVDRDMIRKLKARRFAG